MVHHRVKIAVSWRSILCEMGAPFVEGYFGGRFRNAGTLNENYQLMVQHEQQAHDFQILPAIKLHNSREKAGVKQATIRRPKHQSQLRQGRESSKLYEIRHGGDEDKPYQEPTPPRP